MFLGIRPPQYSGNFNRFNLRNSLFLIFFIACSIMMSMFFILEDGTLAEYASGIYGTLCAFICTFMISSFIWKTEQVYKLMGDFEESIRERMPLKIW